MYNFVLHMLSLLQLTTLSLDQGLSVLVQVKLGDNDLRRMDVNWHRSTVRLLLRDLVHLDSELQSVDGRNLTLLALLGTTGDQNLVLSSDWKRSDTVLSSQLLRKWSG